MASQQVTWDEIKKAQSFAESVRLASERYKIGEIPAQGEELEGIPRVWTAENIKGGLVAAIPGALVMLAGALSVYSGHHIAGAMIGGFGLAGGISLVNAVATKHRRGGYLLKQPKQAVPAVAALPADMDDGTGAWWGQQMQDALDNHFCKKIETVTIVDGLPVTTVTGGRSVHVRALNEALNVNLYELEARKGFDPNSIKKVSESINLSLKLGKGLSISIDNNIGNGRIGLYVPKNARGTIAFAEMLPALARSKAKLPWVLGQSVSGENILIDLEDCPHLKMQGTTKSGKSVAVQAGVIGLAAKLSPKELRLWFADPKDASLPLMEDLPHVECMASTAVDFMPHLERLIGIYTERKDLWKSLKMQDAHDLAAAGHDMPYHIVIIEEAAGLLAESETPIPEGLDDKGKEIKPTTTYEKEAKRLILMLANKGRAARIHLVFVSQYMARSVFPPSMLANILSGISFRVDAESDSRMVLGQMSGDGAESLLGKGDGYVKSSEFPAAERFQGAFLTTAQIKESVVKINKKWIASNAH